MLKKVTAKKSYFISINMVSYKPSSQIYFDNPLKMPHLLESLSRMVTANSYLPCFEHKIINI